MTYPRNDHSGAQSSPGEGKNDVGWNRGQRQDGRTNSASLKTGEEWQGTGILTGTREVCAWGGRYSQLRER